MEVVVGLLIGELAGELLLCGGQLVDFGVLGVVGGLCAPFAPRRMGWLASPPGTAARSAALGGIIYTSVVGRARMVAERWDGISLNPGLALCTVLCVVTYYAVGRWRQRWAEEQGGRTNGDATP
ncbi:MAG: hypothetical protein HZB16_21125 [Armatimonadetes bacterium]|nr:hypothetical protein [Armatimonadota bacterium]